MISTQESMMDDMTSFNIASLITWIVWWVDFKAPLTILFMDLVHVEAIRSLDFVDFCGSQECLREKKINY